MSEETSFEKATKYMEQGQYKDARKSFKKAIKDFEAILSVEYKIGSPSLDLNATNFEDLLKMAFSYAMIEDIKAAKRWFAKATDFDPESAEAWGYLAAAYASAVKKKDARKNFEKALELNPNMQMIPLAWSFIGLAYFELKEYEKAIEYYKTSVELSPWDAASLHDIGYAYFELGDYKQAIEYFEKAIEEGEKEPKHKAFKKFKKHLKKALKKYPQYYEEKGIEK